MREKLSGKIKARQPGGCLICGSRVFQRGLCQSHYFLYRRTLQAIKPAKRAAFEKTMIRSGRLETDRRGQKPDKVANPCLGAA